MNRKTITLLDSTMECEHVNNVNVPQRMMYSLSEYWCQKVKHLKIKLQFQ